MERKLKQAKNLRIRNMIKSRFFFLLLVCIFSLNVQAVLAERQYYFRTLDINNGLSQNTVYDIIQDRTGFLWFATANGLNRYDGLSFQVFVKENGGLGNNFVTALYEDASGQIWVGTDDGVYIYTPETESFRYFDMKSDLGTTMRSTVSVIQGDEQGNVWISVSAQGLFCYNRQAKQIKHFTSFMPPVFCSCRTGRPILLCSEEGFSIRTISLRRCIPLRIRTGTILLPIYWDGK